MLIVNVISAKIRPTFLVEKCFFILINLLVILTPFKSVASIIPFINEIHYDNQGADSNEFVEISGLVNTNLDNWYLYLYNGSNAQIYKTYSLTDKTFENVQNGYGFITIHINGIQNGSPDGIALVDANANIIQFISYEGKFTIQYDGQKITSSDIGVSESNSTNAKLSLQLSGTGNFYRDFNWQNASQNTVGMININQQFITISSVSEPNSNLLFLGGLLMLLSLQRNVNMLRTTKPLINHY